MRPANDFLVETALKLLDNQSTREKTRAAFATQLPMLPVGQSHLKSLLVGSRYLLLIVVYFAYLSIFALLLQWIENPQYVSTYQRQRLYAIYERHHFVVNEIIPTLFNNTQLLLFVHGEKSRKIASILSSGDNNTS